MTGNNSRTVGPRELGAHDGFGQGFMITVLDNITLGEYSGRIVVTADNMSPQIIPIDLVVM